MENNVSENIEKTVEPNEKRHLFGKVISGVIALGLLVLASYSIVLKIVSTNQTNINSYILLDGKNASETREILSQFGNDKQKEAKDFSIVGNKLFLSENKITPSFNFLKSNDYNNIALYDVINKTKLEEKTSYNSNKYYLDLSKVNAGEYLIFPYVDENSTISSDKDYNFYSIDNSDSISYSVYSLPDKDKNRKRITIKNNSLSPYTIISIKDTGDTLPSDYYDMVLFYQEYVNGVKEEVSSASIAKLNTIASELNNEYGYQIKVCSSLKEAININATLSFAVSSEQLENSYCSLYTSYNLNDNLKTSTFIDGELKGYDSIPEIRENVGYIDKGGEAYSSILGNDIIRDEKTVIGKESFLTNDEKNDILSIIQMI